MGYAGLPRSASRVSGVTPDRTWSTTCLLAELTSAANVVKLAARPSARLQSVDWDDLDAAGVTIDAVTDLLRERLEHRGDAA